MPSEGPYFLPSHLFPHTYVFTYRASWMHFLYFERTLELDSLCNWVSLLGVDDVLRARLKTVGVSDHRFEMESAAGRDSGTEWRIIDVGGSRSQVSVVQL